jgi:hypothetical protein
MIIKSPILRLNHGIHQGRGDSIERGPVQPPVVLICPQFIEWIPMAVQEDRIRFAIGMTHLIIGGQGQGMRNPDEGKKDDE